MVKKWDVKIPPLTGERTRKAYIYLPDYYDEDEFRRYPVLYMFDGHNVFFDSDAAYGKSWGMNSYMTWNRKPLIIVAVECNKKGNGRMREYSPYSFEDPKYGKIRGRGKVYMDWLVNELKPYIDKNYRTLPDREHTIIAGSSMGGLMSLYAVVEYNDVFSRAACLSPSLWVARWRVDNMIQRAKLSPDTVIYMDYGSREMGNHDGMRKLFASVTARLMDKQVWVTSRIVPNGDHCEACWEEQIPFFMHILEYCRE